MIDRVKHDDPGINWHTEMPLLLFVAAAAADLASSVSFTRNNITLYAQFLLVLSLNTCALPICPGCGAWCVWC